MTTIAHLSDLHLGLTRFAARTATRQNQREADMQRAADVVGDHLIELRPDIVVIAGDFFDKFHVGTAGELAAVRLMQRLSSADLPVVVIGGNHDQPDTPGSDISLGHLRERGARVYLEQGLLDLGHVRLHLVPYRTLSRFYRGAGAVNEFQFSDTHANVLVAHGYAAGDGVTYPPEPVQIPADWLTDERFALSCLGHVHLHLQIAPRVFYGGVIERTNFGEVNVEPAFWIHTIDEDTLTLSESRSVRVADLGIEGVPRPMYRIDVDAAEKTLDELTREVEPLICDARMQGAMLDLHVTDVSVEFTRQRVRAQWERLFAQAGGLHIDIQARPRRVREMLDVKFAGMPTSIPDAFEQFINGQDLSDDRRRELLDVGLEVLGIAHEKVAREAVK